MAFLQNRKAILVLNIPYHIICDIQIDCQPSKMDVMLSYKIQGLRR
jgi:hypothetical protein